MTTNDHSTPRPARLGKDVWAQALRDYAHLSDKDLAKLLRVTVQTVDYHRRKGQPRAKPPKAPRTPKKPAPPRYDWDEILRVYSHLNNREIAQIVGVSHQAVSLQRTRRELPSPSKRRTDAEWRAVFAVYPESTPREIAHAIGCHPHAVYLALKRTGTKPGRRGVARFLPSRARITPEMVRPWAMLGLSNTKIAEQLGCHWMTVRRVRAGAGIPSSYEIRRLARTRL